MFLSSYVFALTEAPHLQEIPIPSLGRVWIVSGTAHCHTSEDFPIRSGLATMRYPPRSFASPMGILISPSSSVGIPTVIAQYCLLIVLLANISAILLAALADLKI